MEITIKTLSGGQFTVNLEAGMKISEVKDIVEAASNSTLSADRLKLIYNGKVLAEDTNTLASYNVADKSFIVCMMAKVKAAAPVTNTVPAAASGSRAEPNAAAASRDTGSAPAPSSGPISGATSSTGGLGSAAEEDEDSDYDNASMEDDEPFLVPVDPVALQGVVAVTGAEEMEATAALQAAFGNADLAVDYLLNGFPDDGEEDDEHSEVETSGIEDGSGEGFLGLNLLPAGYAAQAGTAASPTPLEQFRNHPQFAELRRLVAADPSALQQVLQQIGQQSPAMLAAIQEDPAGFLALLNAPLLDDGGPQSTPSTTAAQAPARPPALAQREGVDQMELSPEEGASVQRLVEISGFSRAAVVEAFIACDRNEERAANFLFDN